MKALALPRGDWPLIVGGAILLCTAYPPFHLVVPSFVCLIPAVWLISAGALDQRPLRRHLVQGFWFGLLSNGLILYWMVVALWRFTKLSALGYGATIVVLGLTGAALFALTGWVARRTSLSLLVVFPVLWTMAEWLIGHLSDVRFPWLGLGTSLSRAPTLVQIADVVGARGLTLLLAAANTALALAWLRRHNRPQVVALAGGVAAGIVFALGYGIVRERTLSLRPVGNIVVLQPNVDYDEKWQPGNRDAILQRVLDMSAQAIEQTEPDLVVWPEAAVPDYFIRRPNWATRIAELARESRTPQFVGGLDAERTADGRIEVFNAAFLFDSLGRSDAYPVYHKRYLVPITERVPFLPPRWFRSLEHFGGATPGRETPVYRVGIGRFGTLICYESAFEDLSRSYRRQGADFLLNITNDAWFGRTSAPYQHAAHLVMRAIENRVGIARAANTGISEFVDPLGREYRRTGLYVRAVENHELVTSDVMTIYTRWGDWVGTLNLMATLFLVGYALWRKR
ncbi:MAG: apolipoprotein N-acyltransferase [Gemmatimonadales bacterium]|nr:apolipoprotein N-acyltransferase [Gemmatimonadales bacterium]NIN12310.1 apolipoprotein N-acyltransferase [Gemmatimonadales bacterium]NIN48848.1 apolipoprotein N-acyltransferase [Gemmatimonadales bacterium]NIP06312.1 apolipoprotein N-acyltransferase [Gemmatimonadales bacterium]NIR00684.1 apolipoprotein N-acyltransferase [Gemmatimonadales bacterium]